MADKAIDADTFVPDFDSFYLINDPQHQQVPKRVNKLFLNMHL